MEIELIIEIAKYIVPAIVFFGAAYYITNRWYEIQLLKNKIEVKSKAVIDSKDNQLKKHFFPLQVDAAQRLVLFLERISPNNLIMRLHNPGLPALAFQQKLLTSIRSEFEHNLAQQIFVSPETWKKITDSKENIVKIIISAATDLGPTALAGDLSQKVFEITAQLKQQPIDAALLSIKREINKELS